MYFNEKATKRITIPFFVIRGRLCIIYENFIVREET